MTDRCDKGWPGPLNRFFRLSERSAAIPSNFSPAHARASYQNVEASEENWFEM